MYNFMEITTRLKRWGNSLGIVIPSETIKQKSLQEDEEVIITIERKKKIREIFGSLRSWKINAQKVKNESRKEWE